MRIDNNGVRLGQSIPVGQDIPLPHELGPRLPQASWPTEPRPGVPPAYYPGRQQAAAVPQDVQTIEASSTGPVGATSVLDQAQLILRPHSDVASPGLFDDPQDVPLGPGATVPLPGQPWPPSAPVVGPMPVQPTQVNQDLQTELADLWAQMKELLANRQALWNFGLQAGIDGDRERQRMLIEAIEEIDTGIGSEIGNRINDLENDLGMPHTQFPWET